MRRSVLHIACVLLFMNVAISQDNVSTGAFSRVGFGARGMGMGNALTAVPSGSLSGYYNPALPAFSSARTGSASFGILSLDRYLNVLSYTQAIKPSGGLSFGILNAGVRHIDGRDRDGNQTEEYSVTENQFSLAFSNQFTEGIAVGIAVKLYYAKLFEEVSSSTVGFDIGLFARVTDELGIGLVVKEIGSKYKWETSSIYGTDGKSLTNRFPLIGKIAVSYSLPGGSGLLAAEFESSSGLFDAFRVGGEYALNEYVVVRAGVDRWTPGADDTGPRPAVGFTVANAFSAFTPSVTYAFVSEPVAPNGMHIISLAFSF
jgi:hypothetical protein